MREPGVINVSKPTLKLGDKLCSGCWKITQNTEKWHFVRFKYLEPNWLCDECAPDYYAKFTFLQEKGL